MFLLFAALATFLSEAFWATQWPARLRLLLLVNISAETLAVSVSLSTAAPADHSSLRPQLGLRAGL